MQYCISYRYSKSLIYKSAFLKPGFDSVKGTIQMDYKEYKASRNLAWEFLLREKVNELPLKVSDICAKLGIALKSYRSTDGNCGFCNIVDGTPYIFVDSGCERFIRRFTAAHELGHILLGHVGEFMQLNDLRSGYTRDHERAADAFAMRLLAPACVLWGCGVSSASEIAKLCDLSLYTAELRMSRMKILYERNKFLVSENEKEVYEQFHTFIYRYRQASGR